MRRCRFDFAEAQAIRRIIEDRFGKDHTKDKRWMICGDFNDYRERIVIGGDMFSGLHSNPSKRNILPRRASGRWLCRQSGRAAAGARPLDALSHARSARTASVPVRLHPCFSAIARQNAKALPDIVRGGQPCRTPFPPGQEVERYPRVGWDRPKASDHCPVAVTLDLV